ncbi:hypothetical protein FA13DRAFT_41704 [Coprinellus micaceus]|uniref:Uncharacterized protein n=1 Tax=Coprinellus micaceus TaxID=71717 RepID=A0A4Y7U0K7_COPMI|nr:hypothetical protein FA13DRAFT_41704 [Coprinellus micaceus]
MAHMPNERHLASAFQRCGTQRFARTRASLQSTISGCLCAIMADAWADASHLFWPLLYRYILVTLTTSLVLNTYLK